MAGVAMKPSWASIAGGSRRLVSPLHRNVRVLAAVAPGLDAGAVVGAAAAAGAVVGLAAGAVVAAAAGAVVAAAAGGVVGLGAAAGAVVGAAAGEAGPHAANRPMPATIVASFKTRRRVGIFLSYLRRSVAGSLARQDPPPPPPPPPAPPPYTPHLPR